MSPSSSPEGPEDVENLLGHLSSWGLRPELGSHALDRRGHTAGTTADRLGDLDAALRDPDHRLQRPGALTAALTSSGTARGDRGWTVLDTLHDLLDDLGVPVLGGLPLGHLDADRGTPVVEPPVL